MSSVPSYMAYVASQACHPETKSKPSIIQAATVSSDFPVQPRNEHKSSWFSGFRNLLYLGHDGVMLVSSEDAFFRSRHSSGSSTSSNESHMPTDSPSGK